jgi:hypothetical protein
MINRHRHCPKIRLIFAVYSAQDVTTVQGRCSEGVSPAIQAMVSAISWYWSGLFMDRGKMASLQKNSRTPWDAVPTEFFVTRHILTNFVSIFITFD